MDFVINNYLWFIIGAIVLLMIVIGYFAEKTDFGKKPLKNTSKKQSEPVSKPAEEVVEPVEQTNDDIAMVPEEISEPVADNDNLETDTLEDLNVPFGDQKIEEPTEVKEEVPTTNDLPEISEVPEVSENDDNGMSDEAEDDVWKF